MNKKGKKYKYLSLLQSDCVGNSSEPSPQSSSTSQRHTLGIHLPVLHLKCVLGHVACAEKANIEKH